MNGSTPSTRPTRPRRTAFAVAEGSVEPARSGSPTSPPRGPSIRDQAGHRDRAQGLACSCGGTSVVDELSGKVEIRSGAARSHVVEHHRLSVTRSFGEPYVARDHGLEDLAGEVAM